MSFLNFFSRKKNNYNLKDFNEMDKFILSFSERLKNATIIQSKNTDTKYNLDNIISDYVTFFTKYKKFLEIQILRYKNKNKDISGYYNHLLRINILYNEIYNFTKLMKQQQFYDSYIQQKNFLENKLFNKILFDNLDRSVANQVIISTQLKIILSILNFKAIQNIHKQQIELDLNRYFNEIENVIMNGNNKKNIRMFYLLKSLYYYLSYDKEKSMIYLGYLFNFDYSKYKNKIYAMPLQYTGLGENPHLTMFLPNEFKNFINEKLITNKFTNEELDEMLNKTQFKTVFEI